MAKLMLRRFPPPNYKPVILFETNSLEEARQEYYRLQGIYPGVELDLVAENEYGERTRIHNGYWFRKHPSNKLSNF